MSEAAPKYWAFISYSHSDARAAADLQRWLETYRIPRRLVGALAGIGAIPPFLKPVFRDRSELQAGSDLTASVREALRQSRYLIVVCSPEAARSRWVSQEITEFKHLNGASKVLALIVAGEPFASRMPGREAEECFPEPLREGEPIAADLRPQGDGPRLAKLKLVAGMIGVGVDELVRRDAQRRARRMAAVATASAAGMAVMAVLTFMAVQSRNEAQSQRAQAEDLLEFMLGDLRKKLVPVGRLDVLDAVGGKALVYYDKQDAVTLDANALGRRSRALHVIGEMREQRGQLEEALAAFKSAADTTGELLQRYPRDGQRIFDHAQSVYWVGYVAFKRGESQRAERAFLEYRALAQKLVAIDPSNVDWQLETAYANQNLGVVQLKRGNLDAALQSFSATRDTLGSLIPMRPALGNELADTVGWISRVREAAGDYAGAIEAQHRRLEVLRATPGAEKDHRIKRQIANTSGVLGHLHMSSGDMPGAESHLRAAVEALEVIVALDPANMSWLGELCITRVQLARVERMRGKLESARRHFDLAQNGIANLLKRDATSLRWQIEVKGNLLDEQTGLAIAQGGAPPLPELDDFVATARRIEASGKVFDGEQTEMVSRIELLLGDALALAGKRHAATEHWNAAMSRLQSKASDASNRDLTILARTYLRLDRRVDADMLLARVEASNYRHPAYADLVNEARHGTGPERATISRR